MKNYSKPGTVVNLILLPRGRYFSTVKENQAWEKSERPAFTNAAGAATGDAHNALTVELQELHGSILHAQFINWFAWAGYILALPQSSQQAAKTSFPPPNIINAFTLKRSGNAAQNKALEKGMTVSVDVSKEYEETITTTLETIAEMSDRLDFLRQDLKGALIGVKAYSKCIKAISQGITPVENELARAFGSNVEDAEYEEHMVPPPVTGAPEASE